MSYPNPLLDHRRRRRHRHGRASQQHSPLTSIATTAAVAYGAYRIGKWAYNSYFGVEDDKEENDDGGNDLLNQWTSDYQSNNIRQQEDGFDYIGEISDTNNNSTRMRHPSRRSRADWSNDRSKARSNSPSPPQDYHHHTNQDGTVKQSMTKAASMASNGLGAAVSKGISAGIHAYNKNNIPNNNSIPEQERRLRMGRCRLETSRAMIDFLPTLKKAVVKETDVSEQTNELKRLRIKKKEILEMKQNGGENGDITAEEATDKEDIVREKERCLWNDIKNKSLTRLVTTIYAHTIIFLVLNVQVNLLGGQLLREELEEEGKKKESEQQQSSKSSADQYRASHQIVLSKTYHYLFTKGIPALAESVGKEANDILQKWDVLGDDVKLTDVNTWIESIRDKMEHQKDGGMMSRLVEFVIPPEGDDADANSFNTNDTTDELAKYILDETYDLLESPAFAKAERQCLDTTFDHLRVKVLGKIYLMEDEIPLANVVTQLQKTAVSTFHKPPSHKEEMKSWGGILGMMEEPLPSAVPNDYISRLERLDTVQELSNVCF